MSRLPPIIGIAGKAGVGKDTLAAHLVAKHGYTRYGFADPIKQLLNQRFGWSSRDWEDRKWKERPASDCGRHWIQSGMAFSPRSWAQWLGTEVGRNTFGPDCWVNAAGLMMDRPENRGKSWVIADVRFENEAAWIRQSGGIIIHLKRDVPTISAHVSEAGIASHYEDWLVCNTGTIEEMFWIVDSLMEEFT